MSSHHCIGDIHGSRCRRSRKHRGARCSIRGPCEFCGELRCRSHCLCGRAGTATGQNAARPGTGAPPQAKAKAKAKARVAPAVALAAPPAPHAPVGRAGALSLEVLDTIEWYGAILQQVEYASEVVLATYMFDH